MMLEASRFTSKEATASEIKMTKKHQVIVQDYEPITRGDIRNLLRAYSGAIALDQIRVDALPLDSFHPAYNRQMWLRYRRCHTPFITRLLRTTRDMSTKLVQKVSLLASSREPKLVRKQFVEMLSRGAASSFAPGYIDTAPLFFAALVEDVGTGWIRGGGADVNARARFERWLDIVDPLFLAEDPECQYLARLKESAAS